MRNTTIQLLYHFLGSPLLLVPLSHNPTPPLRGPLREIVPAFPENADHGLAGGTTGSISHDKKPAWSHMMITQKLKTNAIQETQSRDAGGGAHNKSCDRHLASISQ